MSATAVEIISSRAVPLGGPRAMTVHRTLPHRQRSLIGAWCFVDHFGPDDVSKTGGMDVAPHPHTGLQTATWLYEGEISHVDAGGGQGLVHPGEFYLMTAGNGISHTETTTEKTTILHGVQLWIALPDSSRSIAERDLAYFKPPATELDGGQLKVFMGELMGGSSPVHSHTPMVGAEITIEPQSEIVLELNPDFEHGVIADSGAIVVEDVELEKTQIGYTGIGEKQLRIRNNSEEMGRALFIGGEPLREEILMWWNFIGRDHDEIVRYRDTWQASQGEDVDGQFGFVDGYVGHGGVGDDGLGRNADGMTWLPAPKLPNARMRPRTLTEPVARPNMKL